MGHKYSNISNSKVERFLNACLEFSVLWERLILHFDKKMINIGTEAFVVGVILK